MFSKKNKILIDDLYTLYDICLDGLNEFKAAMIIFYKNSNDTTFEELFHRVKEIEDTADKQVYKIENALFGDFLLPESREDIANLINKTDDIIDGAMHTAKFILLRNMTPFTEIGEHTNNLLTQTINCLSKTKDALYAVVNGEKKETVKKATELVGLIESQCDSLQDEIIKIIYSSSLSESDKILHSQLITQIGNITDSCEDVAEIINIMNLKRVF